MATSDVKVTPGVGKNMATYSFTEDAETKEVGRVVLNTSAGSLSNSATLQSAVSATGNGSTVSVDGLSSIAFTVSGTFVGVVNFEGTEDGTNWGGILAKRLGSTDLSTSTNTTGIFESSVGSLVSVRARVTWTSGTSVTVTAHASPINLDHANIRILGSPVTLASSDNTPITTATDTIAIAAPAAGMHLRIKYLQTENTHATLACETMWRDGAAGTRRYRSNLAPLYGIFAHNIKPDYWDLTTATALYVTTTVAANVHYSVEYSTVPD